MNSFIWIICSFFTVTQFRLTFSLLPFRNTSLSWDERANDIVQRLTLKEIQSHLTEGGGSGHSRLPPIPRLGIKPFTFDTECLHGVNNNATGFPQSIGLAATFNPKLLFEVGNVIGREARAGYNKYSSKGQYGVDQGMVCLTPVINIMRHPLWGRNQETYGEDPFMSGVLADRIVSGLQGPKEYKYMQAATGCKHFDAYTGPETVPTSRFSFNANISDIDLYMTFLPAFKQCVDAGAAALMCSYNAINGIPACANRRLLTDILRKQWNFKGYVISDMGAISHIYDSHHYTATLIDAVAEAMNAGTNFNMPGGNPPYSLLIEAVEKGMIEESTVREAIKPLFLTRLKLGEFDPPEYNIYNTYKFDDIIHSRPHTNTALLAAVQSFVLLKNNREALPIRSKPRKVALIGPFVDDANQQFGSYPAHVEPKYTTTPWTGLKKLGEFTTKEEGCADIGCHEYDSLAITRAINDADYIIACMGLGSWEGEGNDRTTLELPGNQTHLIMDAAKNKMSGARLIVVLFNAGPVDVSWAKDSPLVDAIFTVGYPAQATGEALFNVLTLKNDYANPAGRLVATWPTSLAQVPPMIDYSMNKRTYRYFEGNPMYPFGYGLSYTVFQYSNLKLKHVLITAGNNLELSVSLSNIGWYTGDEVVQAYISWESSSVTMPKIQLAAFKRVERVKIGKTLKVTMEIPYQIMAGWKDGLYIIEQGTLNVYVGGQQPFQKTALPSNILHEKFFITGTKTFD